MKIDKTEIRRILFVSLSNIGDIVLTTPAIRVLSENFPDARIDIMVGPNGAELFRKDPAIFKVVTYNKHLPIAYKRRLVRKLRKVKYDLIVDLRNSLFPFLLGARYRTSPIQVPPKTIIHKKDQHLWKLSSIGLNVQDAPFYLHIPQEDDEFADRVFREIGGEGAIIAMSPGAKSDIKRWPDESYAELTDRLIQELNTRVIMVGDNADSPLVKKIVSVIPKKKNIIDLSGRTTLCQLASLLRRCNLLVTNDSAPLHIAGAVGTKVLAIFGPTNPEVYGPTGSEDCVVRQKIHCSPCGKAQCEFEHECMRTIKVDKVFGMAKRMLGR